MFSRALAPFQYLSHVEVIEGNGMDKSKAALAVAIEMMLRETTGEAEARGALRSLKVLAGRAGVTSVADLTPTAPQPKPMSRGEAEAILDERDRLRREVAALRDQLTPASSAPAQSPPKPPFITLRQADIVQAIQGRPWAPARTVRAGLRHGSSEGSLYNDLKRLLASGVVESRLNAQGRRDYRLSPSAPPAMLHAAKTLIEEAEV